MNVPLTDPGNQYAGSVVPATLATGRERLPDGVEYLVATVRAGTATVTVLLNQADAATWAAQLTREAGKMTGLVVPSNGGPHA